MSINIFLQNNKEWINIVGLVVSISATIFTFLAAWAAYRSAKMSEQANRAQFSPLVIPTQVYFNNDLTQSQNGVKFAIYFQNRTEYSNAFTKNLSIELDGKELWSKISINPDTIEQRELWCGLKDKHESFKRFVDLDMFTDSGSPKLLIFIYEDILGNRFKTESKLLFQNIDHNFVFDWTYTQL